MKLSSVLLVLSIVLSVCDAAPIGLLTPAGDAAPRAAIAPDSAATQAQSTAVPPLERTPLPTGPKAPAINNSTWLNVDQPLTQAALNGKVILIDFWTFG